MVKMPSLALFPILGTLRLGSNVFAEFCLWPMAGTFKALFSVTNQMVNKQRRQKRSVKMFLNLSTFIKRNQDEKLLEFSQIF